MDAIETLMNEHRMIERVLDALVGFVAETERKETTEKAELQRFVTFIREFSDAYHHGKEENILFQAMVDNGFPKDGGPIAVMLRDHEEGRRLVRILGERAEANVAWTSQTRHEIAEVAGAYAMMLRAHIHKEDAILYPMAEQHLTPEAMEAVGDACERFEEDGQRAGKHEKLHALAEDLIRAHAAALHPAATSQRHGCCG